MNCFRVLLFDSSLWHRVTHIQNEALWVYLSNRRAVQYPVGEPKEAALATFSCACYKLPARNYRREKTSILTHGFRGLSPLWWDEHGIGSMWQRLPPLWSIEAETIIWNQGQIKPSRPIICDLLLPTSPHVPKETIDFQNNVMNWRPSVQT